MSKYIIKNCPALFFSLGFCCDEHQKRCQDRTDCLIKRIIEKCKAEINLRPDANIDNDFARDILQLSEMQEVE